MAGEWREETLANLCLYINRGAAPAYVDEGGVLVLNQKCVRDQRVSFEEARRTDHELKPITPERMVRRWDVLVNSTGVGTLGRVAQLDVVPEPASVDSHVTIVRPDPDAVYPRFLGFVIRAFEREIESLAEGSTGQTELARTRLASLSVPVAPEDEQRAIAHILGTLDDKIELNRRMNGTLEAIVRAIFKSWFVDFLPVRAKMAARTQTGDPVRLPAATAAQAGAKAESRPGGTGLPKPLADLFPDSFEESELGEIPAGWRVLTVEDIAEINAWTLSRSDPLTVIDYIEVSEVMRGEISTIVRYARGGGAEQGTKATASWGHGAFYGSARPRCAFLVSTPQ